jgi:hypothetical protein
VIRARIALNEAVGPWDWEGSRWKCGRSWIEAFPNPALERFLASDETTVAIVVRERLAGQRPPKYRSGLADVREVLAAQSSWAAESLTIELRRARVLISTGVRGSAPIYALADSDILYLSWRMSDFHRFLASDNIDRTELALYLIGNDQYTHRTLWRNVTQLTERCQIDFDAGGIRIHLPVSALHCEPRELVPGCDPMAAYDFLLRHEIAMRDLPANIFAEISGGLDSANMAITAAALCPSLRSYGLAIGGAAREQQLSRRRVLIRLLGIEDTIIDAMKNLPFSEREKLAANGFFDPTTEPYRECLGSAVDVTGAHVVLTGIGGDELMGLGRDEGDKSPPSPGSCLAESEVYTSYLRELLEGHTYAYMPASVLYEPTLQAAAVRAPVFLERGTWPVNPLASPDLVRFCEWLPAAWRRGRKLHRDRLARTGLGPRWPYPALRENFTDVMAAGITAYGLPQLEGLMADSRLADLSLINPRAVTVMTDQLSARQLAKSGLYELINLELALRALDR